MQLIVVLPSVKGLCEKSAVPKYYLNIHNFLFRLITLTVPRTYIYLHFSKIFPFFVFLLRNVTQEFMDPPLDNIIGSSSMIRKVNKSDMQIKLYFNF